MTTTEKKLRQAEAQAESNGKEATAWLLQAAEARKNGDDAEYARCLKCFGIMRNGTVGQMKIAAELRAKGAGR